MIKSFKSKRHRALAPIFFCSAHGKQKKRIPKSLDHSIPCAGINILKTVLKFKLYIFLILAITIFYILLIANMNFYKYLFYSVPLIIIASIDSVITRVVYSIIKTYCHLLRKVKYLTLISSKNE